MERWDQLYTGGYRFCFGDGAFKPSTDTFLLGGFAQVRRGERVCDLGAGIGLPGLMLLSREPEVHITDIDIDEAACALARRSAEANGLTERIRIIQADLRRREQLPPGGSFDVCVANPPYFPPHTGRVAEGSRGGAYRRADGHPPPPQAGAEGAALRAEGQPHTAPAGAAGLPAGRRHGADRPHTAFITGRTRRRIPGAAPHLFQRQGVMTQWQVYCIW